MIFGLARSLLLADAIGAEGLADALLFSATRRTSLVVALLATGAIDPHRLERELQGGDAPFVPRVDPVLPLIAQLPPELCERLLAVPVGRDPQSGIVDVAVVDARDPHPVAEIAHWLRAPTRMVRATLAAMEEGLRRVRSETQAPDPADGALAPGANIPFALTRKTGPISRHAIVAAVQAPGAADEAVTDPVLDLRRRKDAERPAPDSEAPPTVRGPFSPSSARPPRRDGLPAADPRASLEAIRTAADRDAVLEHLLAGVRSVAPRAVVLAVRRGALVGWTCSPEIGERATIRQARLTPAPGSLLATALAREEVSVAAIPWDEPNASLVALMNAPASTCLALVAARIDHRPAAVVVAEVADGDGGVGDGGSGDGAGAGRDAPVAAHAETAIVIQDLARAAGEALARVLRAQRR